MNCDGIIVTGMNHPFKIKICGVTTPNDAQMVAATSADAIGLNFYAAGKRAVDAVEARSIVAALAQLDSSLVKVGVFVNSEVDKIVQTAQVLGLDSIQLHGDQTPQFLQRLIDQNQRAGRSMDYIRAIRTCPSGAPASAIDRSAIETEIRNWTDAGVDAILIDAAVAGSFGGTGKQVDWHGFAELKSPVPKFLAGGLTPENVKEAIRTASPDGVDVASGVESNPRNKDSTRTNLFCESAREALD